MSSKNTRNKKKERIVQEVELPKGVSASYERQILAIKGAKGEIKRRIKEKNVLIKMADQKIIFETGRATKKNKKMIGSLVAHAKNMIKGSLQSHAYILKICSGHFPMNVSVSGSKLSVKNFLGEKVPRVLQLKEGVEVKVDGSHIHVTSASKELAGQASADIEQLTRRPGYDSRVFQDGIYIINKDGKELK